jgi:hypothetical protein
VQFSALEGNARGFAVDLRIGIGGPGGGTQIFVPRRLLGRVRSVGPVDRWSVRDVTPDNGRQSGGAACPRRCSMKVSDDRTQTC